MNEPPGPGTLPPPLLEVNQVSHAYREGAGERQILDRLDLQVREGESVALLGRSGCGKSTLLNLISGIEALQSGSIRFGDEALAKLHERERTRFRRRHIGFVYQVFSLFPTLNVAENISLVLELNGIDQTSAGRRVSELLEYLRLGDRAAAFPDQLSGGEQQRVAIARAVAHRPSLILADEPTGNLDAESGERVLILLSDLVARERATLLIVTHSLHVANTADRLLTLENGRLDERPGDFAW
jgi:putative ABC transport system ATP-binding protein